MTDDLQQAVDRALQPMHEHMRSQSESLKQMADAITQLAISQRLTDERHEQNQAAFHRLGSLIDDHETRIRTIERENVGQGIAAKVGGRIGWSAIGMFLALLVWFIESRIKS